MEDIPRGFEFGISRLQVCIAPWPLGNAAYYPDSYVTFGIYRAHKKFFRCFPTSYIYSCWARSIQPKFPEISVQNSMDRFGPTGKVSKKVRINWKKRNVLLGSPNPRGVQIRCAGLPWEYGPWIRLEVSSVEFCCEMFFKISSENYKWNNCFLLRMVKVKLPHNMHLLSFSFHMISRSHHLGRTYFEDETEKQP